MGFVLNAAGYMAYMALAAEKIAASRDYISALDAATGDGDHWANLNMGFQKVVEERDALSSLAIGPCFQRIGMLMMSHIGGSSGVLYGGAYIAASRTIRTPALDSGGLRDVLKEMAEDMMRRGNARPGYKTMIDALFPACEAYRRALDAGGSERTALEEMKAAALRGAESTREMEAVRGRASYQLNKGVGHLDPGAVTMSYQLETLADYIIASLPEEEQMGSSEL